MRNKILIGLILAVLALSFLNVKSCEKLREKEKTSEQLQDRLKTHLNDKGQQEASISVLTELNKRQLRQLAEKDERIKQLSELVSNYKGQINTGIVIHNETETGGVAKTDTVIIKDELNYTTRWNNRWEEGLITANKDSIHWSIKTKNEYEITIGNISNGWFKKKTYEVMVRNLNPNTATTELRSFQFKEKPKRLSIGLQMGYGVSKDLKPTPYLGIGVNLSLINIK